jgi:hypothetical protein
MFRGTRTPASPQKKSTENSIQKRHKNKNKKKAEEITIMEDNAQKAI